MGIGQSYPCLFCLNKEHSMELKLDKKGRPYFVCWCCSCRIFTRSNISMRGPSILWGPLSISLRENNTAVASALVTKAVEREAAAHA